MKRKNVLFVINNHAFTAKHRIPLIKSLTQRGYKVTCAVTEGTGAENVLISNNVKTINWRVSRKGLNLVSELTSIFRLHKIYKRLKPDIVLHATIKPVIYGTIVAYATKVKVTINLITGLGSVFIQDNFATKRLKKLILLIYSLIFHLKSQKIIFQNKNDKKELMVGKKYFRVNTFVINGSGVNVSKFPLLVFPSQLRITLIGRMLREKGINVFIETANIIKKVMPDIRFTLVGPLDFGNPSYISENFLNIWQQKNVIEWWGNKDNILEVYKKSSVIVLPSYREGFPKTLIEAGLCGRPVVATDVPGCRDVVINGVTGYLFPLNDSKTFASIIIDLLGDQDRMRTMGCAGRDHVIKNFSTDVIIPQILDIIEGPLNTKMQN